MTWKRVDGLSDGLGCASPTVAALSPPCALPAPKRAKGGDRSRDGGLPDAKGQLLEQSSFADHIGGMFQSMEAPAHAAFSPDRAVPHPAGLPRSFAPDALSPRGKLGRGDVCAGERLGLDGPPSATMNFGVVRHGSRRVLVNVEGGAEALLCSQTPPSLQRGAAVVQGVKVFASRRRWASGVLQPAHSVEASTIAEAGAGHAHRESRCIRSRHEGCERAPPHRPTVLRSSAASTALEAARSAPQEPKRKLRPIRAAAVAFADAADQGARVQPEGCSAEAHGLHEPNCRPPTLATEFPVSADAYAHVVSPFSRSPAQRGDCSASSGGRSARGSGLAADLEVQAVSERGDCSTSSGGRSSAGGSGLATNTEVQAAVESQLLTEVVDVAKRGHEWFASVASLMTTRVPLRDLHLAGLGISGRSRQAEVSEL